MRSVGTRVSSSVHEAGRRAEGSAASGVGCERYCSLDGGPACVTAAGGGRSPLGAAGRVCSTPTATIDAAAASTIRIAWRWLAGGTIREEEGAE